MLTQNLFNDKVSLTISKREDGNMRAFSEAEFNAVLDNQSKICIKLEVTPSSTARILTTYVNRKSFSEYYEVNNNTIFEHTITRQESELKLADGLVTKSKVFALLLPLADCLGIVFYDETQNILGLLHSGRQNLEEDGAYKFVEYLKKNHNCRAENLQAYFTPHAQNFEIYVLDNKKLAEAAEEQLIRAGVRAKNIQKSDVDTVTNPDFPSNSDGDKTFRFAVAVKLC